MSRSDNPVVVAVREEFPGFDASLWSKVQYPDTYGVKLVPKAKLIADKALKRRKRRDKRKGHTLSWRAGDELLERLQTARKALGVLTYQEVITIAVMRLIEGVEDIANV